MRNSQTFTSFQLDNIIGKDSFCLMASSMSKRAEKLKSENLQMTVSIPD